MKLQFSTGIRHQDIKRHAGSQSKQATMIQSIWHKQYKSF